MFYGYHVAHKNRYSLIHHTCQHFYETFYVTLNKRIVYNYLLMFPFSVVMPVYMTQRPFVTCKEKEHCQLKCTGKPICEPQDECTVSWYQGTGTTNVIQRNESTAIDLEG